MPDETPDSQGDMFEKAWAVAGLLAAIALAWMSIDLLLPRKPTVPDVAD